jgi:hypothetical protein
MKVETNKIECVCHRCSYRWQYRGNSKYIACCPRCKMTVYIPKLLRLRNVCYPGNPKYDISEVISPAGEEEYQQQLDAIEYTHNLLLVHRLIHYFEPIQKVQTGLKNREKQLFGSLIRMYHGHDNVWTELKSVIGHYVSERRKQQ